MDFRSNVYNLYRELFLITPYLATINNLGTPVIKTADKTMKSHTPLQRNDGNLR